MDSVRFHHKILRQKMQEVMNSFRAVKRLCSWLKKAPEVPLSRTLAPTRRCGSIPRGILGKA
jgi:hypothetical protein